MSMVPNLEKSMSCLLPQFKYYASFRPRNHRAAPAHVCCKRRDFASIRTKCLLTAMSPPVPATSPVLDIEKLRLPSVDTHLSTLSDSTWDISGSTELSTVLDIQKLNLSVDTISNSIPAKRPWISIGTNGPPVEENFRSALATKTLLDDEAIIAATAAEAVALAKAAVKLAKDAALMYSENKPDNKPIHSERAQEIKEAEYTDIWGAKDQNYPGSDGLEPSNEELNLLRLQLSANVAVKSQRQIERKAKRAKAVEKASSTNIVSVKSGSSSRKKRTLNQEVEYSDPLRYLRGATGSSKLLTFTEEQELSAAIQDLLKLEGLHEELKKNCDTQPTFGQWAAAAGIDQKTLRKRINYGMQCKDRMIKSNIRLVISIAKNYHGSGMSIQDLVQEGCKGLVRGAEKFDASKGFKFSTYAHWWIKQAVRKALSEQSRTIRVPFHIVEAGYRVKEARKELFSKNGTYPSDEEVAKAAGLSMKRLSTLLLTPRAPLSLDQKVGFSENMKAYEVIADPDVGTTEDIMMREFMKKDIHKVIESLNEKEKRVIQARYGMDDGRMKTLQEIGEMMGVSRERIRQIETSAFRKLKSKRKTKHLEQYAYSSGPSQL